MKTKLLTLFALLALLLVSTAILADGRPTGIRITRAVSGGGTNVEIDISVSGTSSYYGFSASTVWLGNEIGWWTGPQAWQYVSSNYNSNLPFAIDWGDSYLVDGAPLFRGGSGPFTGTFAHTYLAPGAYTVTVGDAHCCLYAFYGLAFINTGNAITDETRYGRWNYADFNSYDSVVWYYPDILAITNTAMVNTGTGIPALNIYGLLAMAFVLVGTGLLVYRRPQRIAT